MPSPYGRYVISYNGEIYNHQALRAELDASKDGVNWRGHSDTETLVECIAAWGLEAALTKCVGMFAFALWDRKERLLHLARDRFGEKPLYYGWVGGDFVFASELKAIRAHPGSTMRSTAARSACSRRGPICRRRCRSIERLFKLEPGCILTVDRGAAATPLDRAAARGAGRRTASR